MGEKKEKKKKVKKKKRETAFGEEKVH